jgi:predicted nucleotidyltransferase
MALQRAFEIEGKKEAFTVDEAAKTALLRRNEGIIEAVKAKAERECPGAVDLIAVTGSFCSGDFYEKSDLDLLIVINDKAGWNVAKCFILGDTAHDIYCHTWKRLERMAEYRDPHVIKLVNVDIVYCSGEEAAQKYDGLREKLLQILNTPLDWETLDKARGYFQSALAEYGRFCLEDDFSRCRYRSAWIIYYIENTLYMLNKEYIRHGIQGIPREICAMKILPEGFQQLYFALITADNLPDLRRTAGELLKSMDALLEKTGESLSPKREISPDALRGTYEEVFSNWKNKMHRAASTSDAYLSLMTAASCQNLYDELAGEYPIKRFDLFREFEAGNLDGAARRFDREMGRLEELYHEVGLPVCRYDSLEEFRKDYLGLD